MRAVKLDISDFRQFSECEVFIGNRLTAIAGNNGTGKSTILGILANSSQLMGHKSYLGKPYKGEFSELFSAEEEHDPSGKQMRLFYKEKGIPNTVAFRTGWQKKESGSGKRFRVIPKRKGEFGKITEAKIPSPVIYLGLSRLYPIGEADEDGLGKTSQEWDNTGDREWFREQYANILSIYDEIVSVDSLDIDEVSRKRGTGITTGRYGSTANSAGQDNLGQILLSMLSFKKLKRDMGADWDGGLLLIDELDATLHPAAQLRLISLMEKEAKSVGYQIVFTTHSTVILKELSGKNQFNKEGGPGDIEIAYLTDANRKLIVKRNPTWHAIETDLLVRGRGSSTPVGVFSEDAEARWLIKEILTEIKPDLIARLAFVECPFSCESLLRLYAQDFPYLKDRLVVLDGDVTDEMINSAVPSRLLESGKNLIRLPGKVRPEEIIWTYLNETDPEDPVWEALAPFEISWRNLVENGPLSETYNDEAKERNKYKKWFSDYAVDFRQAKVVHYWIEANKDEAEAFIDRFLVAYNAVAKRTSAIEAPMAKAR